MATKRRHKEEEKGRGRTRAAAIRSHYSTINSKHNANYGRNLQNDKPESLVMEVFRSHRQDSPDWKTTFFLGTFFLETVCEGSGKYINLAFRAPNVAMIVIYSHKPGKVFFSF